MPDLSAFFSLSGQALLYRIVAMLAVVAVHGCSLAFFARLLGDRGPQYDDRLTLNPLAHIEPVGAFTLVFFRLGWIKPLDIDPKAVKGGIWGIALIIVASLALLLAFAALFWGARPPVIRALGGQNAGIAAAGLMEAVARMAVVFVAVNLLPIPPLTMGLLLKGIAPRIYAAMISRLWICALVLGAIILTGLPGRALAPLVGIFSGLLLG